MLAKKANKLRAENLFSYFIGLCLVLLAAYQLHLITLPYPLSTREGAPVLFTRAFLDNINPYTLERMPLLTNVYGFLYNLIVVPFAKIFGPTLVLHRAVSAAGIAGALLLLFFNIRKVGGSVPLALLFVALWWTQILTSVTPHARPDAIGLFLFMLSISIPILFGLTKRNFLIAVFVSILAFYVKQYFLLSGIVLSVYAGLLFGPTFFLTISFLLGVMLVFSLFGVDYIFPLFIENAILIGARTYQYSNAHLIGEIGLWFRENIIVFGGFGILFIQSTMVWRRSTFWPALKNRFRGFMSSVASQFTAPTLSITALPVRLKIAVLPWIYRHYHLILAVLLLPFALKAMGHTGNTFAYSTQIMTPLIFVAVVSGFKRYKLVWLMSLVGINVIWSMLALPVREFPGDRAAWANWRTLLSVNKNVLHPPVFAVLLDDLGKPVYDGGQSQYFEYVITKATMGNMDQLKRANDHNSDIAAQIRNGSFDIVVGDFFVRRHDKKHRVYTKSDSLVLPYHPFYPARSDKFTKKFHIVPVYTAK